MKKASFVIWEKEFMIMETFMTEYFIEEIWKDRAFCLESTLILITTAYLNKTNAFMFYVKEETAPLN